ncbi:sulfatase-like hydrolase/transferase [Nonomuraea sp. 3N208]|uniref:sulfatase-like hydrolase/transferase n=1 Tax=Nonomuraea sp. 3N208 TaxID=3457421 RepID=UPI003FD3AA34
MSPPNVLLIMTDQQSANAMSCTGNADLHTPAIDSLAEAGVRFSRSYCTSPLCAPSRASMITGRMPSELGVNDNIPVVPDSFPTRSLGVLFRQAAYDTAHAGKWHVPGVNHDGRSGFRQIYEGAHEGLAALIRQVPDVIENSGWVSSDGLTTQETDEDRYGERLGPHFDAASQRVLGVRYADVMCAKQDQSRWPVVSSRLGRNLPRP